MKNEGTLIEEMEEIYYTWDYVSKEKARDMLQKIYFQKFNRLKNIEEQRLVLHNLTTVIMQIRKDMNSAKFYSKTLKEMLDNYPNYKSTQINKERYCKALNNYTECHKNELSKEELTKIYEYCYKTYEKYDYTHIDEYIEKINALFNLSLTNQNFSIVLLVVEDLIIHTANKQYEEILQNFINDIKKINNELYKQVKVLIKEKQAMVV